MAEFTCPVCEHVNRMDPPNGEWWLDSECIDDAHCEECGADVEVSVCVEITLTAEVSRG